MLLHYFRHFLPVLLGVKRHLSHSASGAALAELPTRCMV
jgi:hypothetical protein